MQIISNDKTVGSFAVQKLTEFNSQLLSTRAKKEGTTNFYDACY